MISGNHGRRSERGGKACKRPKRTERESERRRSRGGTTYALTLTLRLSDTILECEGFVREKHVIHYYSLCAEYNARGNYKQKTKRERLKP
jgi:hypothetical protein